MDCVLAFTAVPGYHENTSVSVAQAVQAAEPVTSLSASSESTGSWREKNGKTEKEGRRGMRRRVGTMEGGQGKMRGCVAK